MFSDVYVYDWSLPEWNNMQMLPSMVGMALSKISGQAEKKLGR
jgi:hypothetical protein